MFFQLYRVFCPQMIKEYTWKLTIQPHISETNGLKFEKIHVLGLNLLITEKPISKLWIFVPFSFKVITLKDKFLFRTLCTWVRLTLGRLVESILTYFLRNYCDIFTFSLNFFKRLENLSLLGRNSFLFNFVVIM